MTIEVREGGAGGVIEVQFTLPAAAHDGAVSVVGSFNDWTPGINGLETQPDGTRSVVIMVTAGSDVHFRYLGADGVWFDDPDADEVTEQGSIIRAYTLDPDRSPAEQPISANEDGESDPTPQAADAILRSAGPGTTTAAPKNLRSK